MPHILQIFLGLVLGILALGLLFRLVERVVPAGLPRDVAYIGVILGIVAALGGGGHYFGWFG